MAGGCIVAIERSASRTRYTASAMDAARAIQITPQLKSAIKGFVPYQDTYLDWVTQESPQPDVQTDGYPFRIELDGSSLPRHKMNLIFATCCQADALVQRGFTPEARRLLTEAAMLEPNAGIVLERLRALT